MIHQCEGCEMFFPGDISDLQHAWPEKSNSSFLFSSALRKS